MSLLEKDKDYVWHPFTQHFKSAFPIEIVKAEGVFLYDSNGKSYIDANSSWWVNTHGHAHPHLGEAINKQFKEIDHVVFAGTTHPKAVELAERICSVLPNHFHKVFFSDNGSTAVEVALKMAVQYWHNQGKNKHRFLALNGSYHGDTFGAMSVGQRGYFNAPFEPLFFATDYIDFPNETNYDQILEKADELLNSGEFAGIIVEPLVQGAAGMRMYSSEFLDALTSAARRNNALVIFDEVMTGFGRTGKLFAMDHCDIKPDIVALSKGLTGGVMALGLTVTSNKVFEAFLDSEMTKALLHGHSFTANPIACAVACASLDLFERKSTWKNIESIAKWHSEFKEVLLTMGSVTNVRQQGTILAFDIVTGHENNYFSDIKTEAYNHFLNNGILMRPLGNTVFINPPYCIEHVDYLRIRSSILNFLERQGN